MINKQSFFIKEDLLPEAYYYGNSTNNKSNNKEKSIIVKSTDYINKINKLKMR